MVKVATKTGIFIASVCFISLALILNSLLFVHQHYIVPLYWDQWEFAVDLANSKSSTLSLAYLFQAHNEHVIATTKLFFILDYYLLDLTNGPLIVLICIAALCISWLLAKILFFDDPNNKLFYVFWLVFSASGLSLAQWENLLWGFQPQFLLVLIATLTSILIGLKMTDRKEQPHSGWWFIVLAVTTGLGVFSMGNGVALPVSVLILLFLRGYSTGKTILFAFMGILFLAAFFALTRGAVPVGDPAFKTLFKIIAFFFSMLGSPLTNRLEVAAILGLLMFSFLSALFIVHILLPFLRSRMIDSALVGLFVLVSFLIATAAGAAWARTSLGVGAALASRYSTPMLVLWMTQFAIVYRISVISRSPSSYLHLQSGVWILLAVSVAAWSSLRPENIDNVSNHAGPINQAGYFLASGVITDGQLSKLYPLPERIRPVLAFLRGNKLNLYAPGRGSLAPGALQSLAGSAQPCKLAHIDDVERQSASAWQITGWATNSSGQTPKWIVALASDESVLGYTAALQSRPDVEKAMGTKADYRGFVAPVSIASTQKSDPVSLIAIFNGSEAPCRVDIQPLPKGPYWVDVDVSELTPLQTAVTRAGAISTPGIPSVISVRPPYAGATTFGTWFSSDQDTGKVTHDITGGHACRDIIVPVLRGPSSEGVSLEIRYRSNLEKFSTISLDLLEPHKWGYLLIESAGHCVDGAGTNVSVTLKDEGGNWGSWAAMATPGVQH